MVDGKTLKQTVVDRDGLSDADWDALVQDASDAIEEGEDPEEVLLELFGLEPDYIFELLGLVFQ